MAQLYSSIEVCAGAGGQALGLEMAGFEHDLLIEIESWCTKTLRHNRPEWNILQADLNGGSLRPSTTALTSLQEGYLVLHLVLQESNSVRKTSVIFSCAQSNL